MSYSEMSMRTKKTLGSDRLDFTHAALGLMDEAMELKLSTSEENTNEELGDMCWFIALAGVSLGVDAYMREAGFHGAQRSTGNTTQDSQTLLESAALVAGAAKKWLVYEKKPDMAHQEHLLARIVELVRSIGESNGWTLEEVQDSNVRKLCVRFPGEYSDIAALERKKDKERKAILGDIYDDL